MAVFGNMIKQAGRDFIPPAAVLVVGLALSVAVFVTVRGYYADADRQQFQRDASSYAASFKTVVERHVASLTAIRAFVSASRDVTRWEFSTFASQTLPRNSGFRAVLWLPHVSAAQRKTFERSMQRDGLFGLELRELNASDSLVKAGPRSSYLPVAFVEPFEGSGGLIGVDLATNPIYAPLFEAARKSGRATVSAPLTRALVETRGPTVVVVFPLSRRGASPAMSARTGPEGYALGVLELDRVMREAMGTAASLRAAIAYDGATNAPLILADAQDKTARLDLWFAQAEFRQRFPFEIAGKRFVLALRSGGETNPLTRLYAPAGAALLVLALAILVAQSMLTTILRKRQVEKAVIARTAELRALNRTLLEEIDQRRQAEVELRHARDKAESANRAKSAFLSTMSHELRTPLNAIIGFSGILTQSAHDMDPRTRDYLAEINASGLKLLELINDILEITEMEAGEPPVRDLVFAADLVEAALAAIAPLADKGAVSLRRDVAENLPPLRGDGKRLKKALYNLLSNAVKFTGRGGWAQVGAHTSEEGLVIEVRDSGVGMAAIADRLNIFSQGDSSLTRRHDGVGLGLTYVKRVADQHGARLEITSEVGVGTCVRMIFKVEQPANIREVA
jgi:signal transduction histidine kinase